MNDPVTLTATWSRAPLPAGSAQVNYLLIEAYPVAVTSTAGAPPLNFCLVLDRSGSMAGEKLQNLKRATAEVLASLRQQDVISVVLFDDDAPLVLIPAQQANDIPALQSLIEGIQEQGGTAMSRGLQAGLDELKKFYAAERLNRMLLLTDGQTWGDEDDCRSIAATLGQMGIPITALGLGDEWNEKLLDDLAAASSGQSDYIAKPDQIARYFRDALQTTQTTLVQQARLLLRLAGGVQPRAVYQVLPRISNLGYKPIGEREVIVNIGQIAAEGASVLLDLLIPERAPGTYRLAQAELQYDAPALNISGGKIKLDVTIDVSADPAASSVNPGVMNTVEKVTAFKLQTRALKEAEAGNIGEATQKLRAAATRLLDLGELELAQTMQESAERLEAGQSLAPAEQKKLTYATRRLTQKLEE